MPARFGDRPHNYDLHLIKSSDPKPLSDKDYATKPITIPKPKKLKKVVGPSAPVDASEPVVEVSGGADTIDAAMTLEKTTPELAKSAVATKVSAIDEPAPEKLAKSAAATKVSAIDKPVPEKQAIVDAVKKTTRNGTKLYHLKTSFQPHLMTPDAKMTAEHCYGIAVKRSKGESTVSMYHCPAVKGTCPSKLTSACTLSEITRIPSGVDVEAKVDEALLMRY